MARRLLVFDSHPVQYRVPIWQYMSRSNPGSVHVVYASDCSVRGTIDKEFGQTFVWDDPMMTGYEHTVLNCESGVPLNGWGSLTGKGVKELIVQFKPDAILLTGLNYKYDAVAYLNAKRMGIPLWLRCETQDYSLTRSQLKSIGRSLVYRAIYKGLDRIFFIGELNKLHYLNTGVPESKLAPARYFTLDRFEGMTDDQKVTLRAQQRQRADIKKDAIAIGFSGKFIEKKNPKILYKMLEYLPDSVRKRIHIYFMGSGELEGQLRALGEEAAVNYGVKTYFSGFVNQSQLAEHYLAMDIMVLPSRRMGETWGLVTNEAMQSGASVIVSNAVGSSADFNKWERFRIFKDDDAKELAEAIMSLSRHERNFNWARPGLVNYSLSQTAETLSKILNG